MQKVNFLIFTLFLIELSNKVVLLSIVENEKNDFYSNDLIYSLSSGLYEADSVTVLDKKVHKLIGVPYAEIPRAFEKSHLKNASSNQQTNKANKWFKLCLQTFLNQNNIYGNIPLPQKNEMSLDCLGINLYIPIVAKLKRKERKLSAMIHVHGGSNIGGSGSFFDGSALAAQGDVLVATFNYRLDVQGFLNIPGDDEFTGNYGIWDQLTAIKWLHLNCPNLGCDPGSITVFGHSAGSADTFFLALSKQSQPFIKRVILQSGHGFANWAIDYETELFADTNLSKLVENSTLLDIFKNSNTIQTFNNTINNFRYLTTCRSTRKMQCMKMRVEELVEKFKKVNVKKLRETVFSSESLRKKPSLIRSLFVYQFSRLIQTINMDDLNSLFLYLFAMYSSELETLRYEKFRLIDDENFSLDEEFLLVDSDKNELKFDIEKFMRRYENETDSKYANTDQSEEFSSFYFEIFGTKSQRCETFYSFLRFKDNKLIDKICSFLNEFKYIIDGFPLIALFTTMHKFIDCYFYDLDASKTFSNTAHLNELFKMDYKLILDEMKQCLNTASMENFDSANKQATIREFSQLVQNTESLFKVSLSGDFFSSTNPFDSFRNLNNLDVMLGLTSHDGYYFTVALKDMKSIYKNIFLMSHFLKETNDTLNKQIALNRDTRLVSCLNERVAEFYEIENDLDNGDLYDYYENLSHISIVSDYYILLPAVTQLKQRVAHADCVKNGGKLPKLFVYEFSKELDSNHLLEMFLASSKIERVKSGLKMIPHFSELDFVFGLPVLSKHGLIVSERYSLNYSDEEYRLSILMMKYWSNFAKYGDVNHDLSDSSKWESFEANNPNILNIDSLNPKNDKEIFETWEAKYQFWLQDLPNIYFNECQSKN